MGLQKFESLLEVRERLLGYRAESVARFSGITLERLRVLEKGDDEVSVFEAEQLARLYGIDGDALADLPIRLNSGDAVSALASHEEFRDIADMTRMRIVAAANAARDLITLRRRAGQVQDPRTSFDRNRPPISKPAQNLPPYRQGTEVAVSLRKALRLGHGPIPSIRDLVAEAMPWLTVLYAELGSEGPAGLTFADALRGPTIVLNLDGKNRNASVRRFSLAHELCHILVDWNRNENLAVLSGYLSDAGLDRERRANAFAVRLLCPESALKKLPDDPVEAARALEKYGLPYGAIRLYLSNTKNIELPVVPPSELISMGARWSEAEEPLGISSFPLDSVPPERRTYVANAAARLYSLDDLSRDAFAEALGVTPAEDLEKVLDFFSFSPPYASPQIA